jgi:MFS family permease
MTSATDQSISAGKLPWHRSLAVLLAVLVVADLVAALESSMIYSAFKAIIQETHDPIGAGWLVSAYFVVAGPAAVVAGRLADMYGRKRVLLWVMLVVMSGSILSALSANMAGVIIGRGLQGVSGAIIPLCISILRDTTTPQKFSVGMGVLLSAHAIGTMLGVLVGGIIVDAHHWRSVFVAAAVAAGIGLLGIWMFAPSSRGAPQKLDWLGLGVAPIVATLLFAISSFNKPTVSGAQIAALFVGALVLLAVWVWHELRQEHPLVDLRALKGRNMAAANLAAFFLGVAPSQVTLYFSLLVQQPTWTGTGFGRSASVSGLYTAPAAIFSALMAPLAGWGMGRWGSKSVTILGAVVLTIGWTTVVLYSHSLGLVIAVTLLCAGGGAIANVGITGMVTFAARHEKTGESLGLMVICRSIGSALGAQLIALLLSLSQVKSADGKESFPDASAHTATLVLFCVCGMAIIAFGFAARRETAETLAAGPGKVEGH